MNMFTKIAGFAALLVGLAPVSASTTFDFTSTPNANDPLTYVADGITVTVSAFLLGNNGLIAADNFLEQTDVGLRMPRNAGDLAGVDGQTGTELVVFTFNSLVNLDQVGFSWVETQADFDANPDLANGPDDFDYFFGQEAINSLTFTHLTANDSNHPTLPRPATFAFVGPNANTVFGFGAGFTQSDDDYTIASLTVTAVPEPATWLMMLAGFALTGAALKRRKGVAQAA